MATKKSLFFKAVNSQKFLVKMSWIGPWVSRIDLCKEHWCGSTYMAVRLPKKRQSFLASKVGSKFWWLPWFPWANILHPSVFVTYGLAKSFVFHRFKKAMTVSVLHMNAMKMLVGKLDLKYVSAPKKMLTKKELTRTYWKSTHFTVILV